MEEKPLSTPYDTFTMMPLPKRPNTTVTSTEVGIFQQRALVQELGNPGSALTEVDNFMAVAKIQSEAALDTETK